MRRHVGHGNAEASDVHVDGRDARAFEWGNGVQKIQTVFVETVDAEGTAVLRVDVCADVRFSGEVAPGVAAATRVVNTIRWR